MLLKIVAGDQISSKESDCARFCAHSFKCDTRLTETSQHLELLRIDTLSDTHTTLDQIKHLSLGRVESIAFAILASALRKISECYHNSAHFLRWVIKRLDLRAVRLGNLLLHLLNSVDERLGLRVLHLLLHRVQHGLLLVLIISVREHFIAFFGSFQSLASSSRVELF